MNPLVRFTASVALLCLSVTGYAKSSLDYSSSWECSGAKFSWYCDEEQAPPPEGQEAAPQPQSKSDEEKAIAEIEKIKKDLDGKRAKAIINPSPENVKAYISAQETMMDKASTFSDVWRRVIWQNPDLNYENKRPVNNAAVASYNDARRDVERKTMDQIRKEWGIFFFFRSDCAYCHKLAPTVKFIAEQYGITVFPISGDGGALKEFPAAQRDNGLADMLGIKSVPMLVLGNIKDRRMIPLASGVISAQDIVERIYILTSTKPGELY